jgi:predicted RNase H-like HicB family nuclease
MSQYLGLIRRDGNSDYGVSFPDLPGLSSGGSTVHEALMSAQSALAMHLGALVSGREAPAPTPIAHLMDDARLDGSIAVLVRAERRALEAA